MEKTDFIKFKMYPQISGDKKLNPNDKLIIGYIYATFELGYEIYSNADISKRLNISSSSVGDSIKRLTNLNYLDGFIPMIHVYDTTNWFWVYFETTQLKLNSNSILLYSYAVSYITDIKKGKFKINWKSIDKKLGLKDKTYERSRDQLRENNLLLLLELSKNKYELVLPDTNNIVGKIRPLSDNDTLKSENDPSQLSDNDPLKSDNDPLKSENDVSHSENDPSIKNTIKKIIYKNYNKNDIKKTNNNKNIIETIIPGPEEILVENIFTNNLKTENMDKDIFKVNNDIKNKIKNNTPTVDDEIIVNAPEEIDYNISLEDFKILDLESQSFLYNKLMPIILLTNIQKLIMKYYKEEEEERYVRTRATEILNK